MSKGRSKIIVIILVVLILAGAGIVFGPRLVHRCSNCDKVFVGTGYYANIISDAVTTLTGEDEKILCKDCAEDEHAVSIFAGKSVEDFKRPLFEKKSDKKK